MSQLASNAPPHGRPIIGYLAPSVNDGNAVALWSGMVEVAQQRDVNLLCFSGGQLRDPNGFSRRANALFDLVDRGVLDGLVIWASSLGTYIGPDALLSFCRRFLPLPIISIGVALPSMPGIVLDSYGGMRAALTHLIEAHGRRRLAFIRGPVAHREAIERYRAYVDVLTEYGLPLDPELVSPPYPWDTNFGAEAIHVLVDRRKVHFDGLAAANDGLALGALRALQARGLQVPGDVALTGFDNRQDGRVITPPLTTVPIRMFERGRQAIHMVLALKDGEPVPEQVSLPTHLIIRQSCGCLDPAVTAAAGPDCETGEHSVPPPLAGRQLPETLRPRILAEMEGELEAVEGAARRAGEVLDVFLCDLDGEGTGGFLGLLDGSLDQVAGSGSSIFLWQGALSALRRQLWPFLAADGAVRKRAEDLWHQARVLIGERAWRAEAYAGWHAGQESDRLHAISRALTVAASVSDLMDILARDLPLLGITSCYVALYESVGRRVDHCRLILAYDERGRMPLPPDGERCVSSVLASGGLLPPHTRHSMVVEPLYFRNEHLGFIMLDGDNKGGPVYRVLQEQIGSALKGVLLLQENVNLYHEALAAQEAAQEGQRLAEEANRMKSRFLFMVSHELRTPLVLLQGLSEMMLREDVGGKPPLPEPYRQDLARIHASAQQLGGLVRDVLDLTRSQMGQLRLASKSLDLGETLGPAILVGEQMAHTQGLDWHVDIAPGLPQVEGDPARLQQVVLNLISNAVKFTAHGEIRLQIQADGDTVTVSVSDTGLGVPPEDQEVIFDEFRQSERTAARGYSGMGIGLAICRQLVTLHGGEIGVRSAGGEESGSTFFFTLPTAAGTRMNEPGDNGSALAAEKEESSLLPLDYLVKPIGSEDLIQALQRFGLDGVEALEEQAILIVDDEPAVSSLHARIVQSHFPRCRVLTAANGGQALEIMKKQRPQLVLLDLVMPQVDGAGVIEAMQRDVRTRNIPVIVLTAQSLAPEDMVRLGRGATAILEKGLFSADETLAQIEQALVQHKRLSSDTQLLVRKVMGYIHEHYAEPVSREDLARFAGISPRHLTRCFAQETGLSPIDYLNRYRVMRARRLLRDSGRSITSIMAAVGFSDSSYFARVFRREVGISPSAYQREHGR